MESDAAVYSPDTTRFTGPICRSWGSIRLILREPLEIGGFARPYISQVLPRLPQRFLKVPPAIRASGLHQYASVRLDGERVRIWVSAEPGLDPLLQAPAGSVVTDARSEEEAMFKSLVLSVPAVSLRSDSLDGRTVIVPDFDVAAALWGWGADFFQSEHGPIPAGARWITVHPNGEGTKGTPVLVEPVKDDSGHMRVIAGVDGKLNLLRIRGLISPYQYPTQHAERGESKRCRLAEHTRDDMQLRTHDAKVKARKERKRQRRAAERSFIKTVAEAMG